MTTDVLSVLALVLMASGAVLITIGTVMGGRREEPSKGPGPGYRINGSR
jgi:hypothetical protein